MRLLPKRIKDLLSRAHQAQTAKHLAARSGVRVIDADTPEEWDAAVEKLLREDPPSPPFSYLIVPRQLSEEEWLLKHPPLEQQTRPAETGPMK